jgi:hypothetical protein
MQEKLNEQIIILDRRVLELSEYNTALHAQFEHQSITQKQFAYSTSVEISADNDYSPEQYQKLVDVVKFLRREKDIVDAKLHLLTGNLNMVTKRAEHLQKSLDEARICLEEERIRNQNSAITALKHNELNQRIEQANLLRKKLIKFRRVECYSPIPTSNGRN